MAFRYRIDTSRWSAECNELFFGQSYGTNQSENSIFLSTDKFGNQDYIRKPHARSAVMEGSFRVHCKSRVFLKRDCCSQKLANLDLSSSSSDEVVQAVRRKPKKRLKRKGYPNAPPPAIPRPHHYSHPWVSAFFLPYP
ncbi:hypothetical protein JTE90_010397 [Oedothorax gibbosus]|uniref:Uncharacterized protein n=1 Tax=Oedothorax gibbosus TaxID=931172 RepID=A0AAV6W278_9ARAC|nr:hypothetical protein JTE90_010397 [Oedothorax gibbosus]